VELVLDGEELSPDEFGGPSELLTLAVDDE
jgi:hypothetical protein